MSDYVDGNDAEEMDFIYLLLHIRSEVDIYKFSSLILVYEMAVIK